MPARPRWTRRWHPTAGSALSSRARAAGAGVGATVEGEVVRLADRIAYVHHDMDDAVRAGIVREDEVPAAVRAVLGPYRGEWLSRMIHDVVQQGQTADRIALSDEIRQAQNRLKDFLSERVYLGPHTADDVRRAHVV